MRFYKMTGSGNDFVMLDGRDEPAATWTTERIRATCDRRMGIGADGLVVLTPREGGEVTFDFWNSDGSRASMCGNAALCSTRLAARLGMAPAAGMTLRTDAGPVQSACVGDGDDAEIRLPDGQAPAGVPGIQVEPGEQAIWLGTVGVPHLIVLVNDVERVDIERRGRALRHHPATGPLGANANFVSAPRALGRPWLIRTFERGVEGETLACGTGTVAAAIALEATGKARTPLQFLSRGGFPLEVRAKLMGRQASHVWLRGQGRLVFEGTA